MQQLKKKRVLWIFVFFASVFYCEAVGQNNQMKSCFRWWCSGAVDSQRRLHQQFLTWGQILAYSEMFCIYKQLYSMRNIVFALYKQPPGFKIGEKWRISFGVKVHCSVYERCKQARLCLGGQDAKTLWTVRLQDLLVVLSPCDFSRGLHHMIRLSKTCKCVIQSSDRTGS